MSLVKNSQEIIVQMEGLSEKGRARTLDGKWEVIGALPKEIVAVAQGPKRKKIRQGYLRQIFDASPLRVVPRCPYVPSCGGCSLQQMDYEAQLEHKQQIVEMHFAELIQKYRPKLSRIIGCENPWEYRNKMEFSFSENRKGEKFLGLMLAGERGKVIDLKECHLVSPWFIEVLSSVRDWWRQSTLHAYHHSSDQRHLRTLTLREAKQGKGKMVMLTVSGNPSFALKKKQVSEFMECIKKVPSQDPVSIFLQVQQLIKGKPTQFFEILLDGPDHIQEVLHVNLYGKNEQLQCRISPTSFFQPNTIQAELLYSEALQMLSCLENAYVWDLYCGGAMIGLLAAKKAKKVLGVEKNPYAVFDAQWNCETNKITNFSIYKGDVGEILSKEILKKGKADIIVVDPPRSGLDSKTLEFLLKISPKEILYISCHPKTQANDIEILCVGGYKLKQIQPIDQFPHTIHIENICLLQKT